MAIVWFLLIVSVVSLIVAPVIQAWYEQTLDFVADRALNQEKDFCKHRGTFFIIALICSIIILIHGA